MTYLGLTIDQWQAVIWDDLGMWVSAFPPELFTDGG